MFVSSFLIVFVVLFVAWVVGHHTSVHGISPQGWVFPMNPWTLPREPGGSMLRL